MRRRTGHRHRVLWPAALVGTAVEHCDVCGQQVVWIEETMNRMGHWRAVRTIPGWSGRNEHAVSGRSVRSVRLAPATLDNTGGSET